MEAYYVVDEYGNSYLMKNEPVFNPKLGIWISTEGYTRIDKRSWPWRGIFPGRTHKDKPLKVDMSVSVTEEKIEEEEK